ncbi:hypothetical protein BpHYR1_019545 [Brachionus plicatilis]|uniref:Uncharacterized protein n=1 Tax=Brachionus plicatilis TaxID=10195 RepID=A0A3M7R9R3_BRAPC|nr:hypothetical protein BpHYR1_019545 [Brachionus plicatilis]
MALQIGKENTFLLSHSVRLVGLLIGAVIINNFFIKLNLLLLDIDYQTKKNFVYYLLFILFYLVLIDCFFCNLEIMKKIDQVNEDKIRIKNQFFCCTRFFICISTIR